jgi:hypothetical protein
MPTMTATGTARCTCCGMRRKMSALTATDGTPLGLCHDCAHEHIAGIRFCLVQAMRPTGAAAPGSEWDAPEPQAPEDAALARLTAVLGYEPALLDKVEIGA